ncbi:hypothetical protein Bca52824_024946 [Brassica carinata]|uniref:Uncharacterized protein n=1 Tax=Brassica carinata TaxID=52824 RepID=A0A8X8AUB9_BRACI|nr:hypothetical protein Bca52824_024946 [Brassica carinata]
MCDPFGFVSVHGGMVYHSQRYTGKWSQFTGCWRLVEGPLIPTDKKYQGKGNVENQKEAAIKSLCGLRGPAEQVNEILAELSFVGEDKEATFSELFQGKCKKALIIGGGLVLFQQITGQPSVLYYAPSILQTAGFSAAGDATRVSILLGLLKDSGD